MHKFNQCVALTVLFWSPFSGAQEALDPLEDSELVRRAGYGHRTDDSEVRTLDPAVFTDISPFTADEAAVKLPEDQQLPE